MSGFLEGNRFFAQPGWIWLLLLLPLLVLIYRRFIRPQFPVLLISRLPDQEAKPGRFRFRFSPPDFLFGLRLLVIVFVLFSLADLVEEKQTRKPLKKNMPNGWAHFVI